MIRRLLPVIALLLIPAGASAQLSKWCRDNHVADNLSFSFTLGTDGLGLEASTPVTRWADLRAGFSWMPSFHVPMNFDITTFSGDLPTNNISEVQQMVYELTGLEMDDKVKMIGKPKIADFKLLVDVYPFQTNRHWHFTAGFYVGNHRIASAIDDIEEKPTLVGLNIYNRAYDYFTNLKDPNDVHLGGGNYMDPDEVEKLQARFHEYGRIGIHMGDFKDGTPYYMEPASDGTVSAKAFANRFKPYVGFGYKGNLDKEGRWTVGFEAGALFWGGAPSVILHDGVNMTKDLKDIPGKVGDYMSIIKALPVYPSVNFRISYSLW